MRVNGRRGVNPTPELRAAVDQLLGPGHALILGPNQMSGAARSQPDEPPPETFDEAEDLEDSALVS